MKKNKTISETLTEIFNKDDFKYVISGSLTGKNFLLLASIINNTFDGNFVIFDNAGGRKFDVLIDNDEYPNRVKDCLESLKSYILAYRVDGKEFINKNIHSL